MLITMASLEIYVNSDAW